MAAYLDFNTYLQRYRHGEWRAPIFRDMILQDISQFTSKPTILDIGCGQGFDTLYDLQVSLAKASGQYIGVEPDTSVHLGDFFTETHRCFFEDAPISNNSVDIAFAVMVLEHLEHPEQFWAKVYDVLRQGGVFFGFTMDTRHYFTAASALFERLGAKDLYLNLLHGKRGTERYENYPTYYRSNSPKTITHLTRQFSQTDVWTFGRVGQLDYYYPLGFRWLGRTIDRFTMSLGMAGSVLVVRVEK
jgi:SAM-dependent methyltransferase